MRPRRQFYFALARELGMTVRQLLAGMDAYEILEWQAFMKLEEERRENKQSPEVVGENLKIALEGIA